MKENVDISRRENLNTLLGLVGGGFGLAALASACNGQAAGLPEQTGVTTAALSGASFLWADSINGASPNLRTTIGSDSSGTSQPIAVVGGFSAPGDGGGGVFYWSNTSGTDDGGTFIVPSTDGGTGPGSTGPGWQRIYTGPLSVKWFGARGDLSVADDPAIQLAIKAATGFDIAQVGTQHTGHVATKSGSILFPIGQYKIQNPLLYVGDGFHSFTITGEPAGNSFGSGYGGSVLAWYGSTGGVILELRAFALGVLERLSFDGRSTAGICVWHHSDQGNGGAGSTRATFRGCTFGPVVGGSANVSNFGVSSGSPSVCFLVGGVNDGGGQTSESCWYDCMFSSSNPINSLACWKTASAGNTKNFGFFNCGFEYAQIGIDWLANSGAMTIENCQFGTLGTPSSWSTGDAACIRLGAGGSTVVRGCEVECAPETVGIHTGARFVTTGTGPNWSISACALTVEGCFIYITMPSDNMILVYPGMLTLIGNTFAAGYPSGTNQNVPLIGCGVWGLENNASTASGSVYSINNCYAFLGWGSYAPLVDFNSPSTLKLTGPQSWGASQRLAAWSFGDTGLTTTAGTAALLPWDGAIAAGGGVVTSSWSPSVSAGGFATTNAIATTTSPFNVPCNVGDIVSVSFSLALPAGVVLTAQVSATNAVTATLVNLSGSTYAPGAGTLRFSVSPKT